MSASRSWWRDRLAVLLVSFFPLAGWPNAGERPLSSSLNCDGQKPEESYHRTADWLARGGREQAVQAYGCLELLARKGHAESQAALGLAHETGRGLEKDYAKAFYWHRKAADSGHAESMKNLGVMYENGQGVGKDMARAETWYRRAAVAGNAKAQRNVGRFFLEGLNGESNEAEAIRWFRSAARQGDAKAQFALAQILSRSAQEKDRIEAYAWLAHAAAGFDDEGLKKQAAELRDRVGERLSESQRQSAGKVLDPAGKPRPMQSPATRKAMDPP